MEMFLVISSYVVIIILIIFMVMLIIITNRNLYCAIFEHKDRKLWKYFIKNANNFKIVGSWSNSTVLEYDEYKIWVWHDSKSTSVHLEDKCVLCGFDEKMSKQMYNTLKELGKI